MNREYNETMMERHKDRNKLIVRLSLENKTFKEIKEKLIELGYEEISKNRIWNIWKNSEYYKPRIDKTMFCNFCLENKNTNDLFHIRNIGQYKLKYRICKECIEKYLPKQPILINENE